MALTQQEKMEGRFRRGGVCYILVGLLAAAYSLHLHMGHGVGQPPSYGLALNYVIDWIGRSLDRVGGIFGGGWEPRAFQANLILAGVVVGLGLLSWLGSRVHRLFSFLGVLPQLGSRLVYVAGMAFYLFDTLLALGLEVGVRRIYHVDGFALQCIILHTLVLLVLIYGFSTGLLGLWLGFVEFVGFLRAPLATIRRARQEAARQADEQALAEPAAEQAPQNSTD